MGTRANANTSLTGALEDDQTSVWAITRRTESVASLKDHIKEKMREETNKLDQNISAHIRSILYDNVQLKKRKKKTGAELTEEVDRQQGTINYCRSVNTTFNDRIIRLESYLMRDNPVISGLEESTDESADISLN